MKVQAGGGGGVRERERGKTNEREKEGKRERRGPTSGRSGEPRQKMRRKKVDADLRGSGV